VSGFDSLAGALFDLSPGIRHVDCGGLGMRAKG
jgi:hypothetical protein